MMITLFALTIDLSFCDWFIYTGCVVANCIPDKKERFFFGIIGKSWLFQGFWQGVKTEWRGLGEVVMLV